MTIKLSFISEDLQACVLLSSKKSTMEKLYSSLLAETKAAGQQQVLRFWAELDVAEQVQLAEQINMLNLKDVNRMFSQANVKNSSDCSVEPVGEDMIGRSDSPAEQVDSWREAGLEALGLGEVGVILLAGGQGTRLGSDRPKALYDVGLPSKKTLIELQAERIRKLEDLAKGRIPWYVMASPATVGQVREAFETSSNFGMEEDQVKIFCQGTLPCLSEEGDILLQDHHTLAASPDGNGGLYKALKNENILDDMKSKGIKHIFVYCVDNILVKVADRGVL
jgi:UDP-N-acetylglucosamine/UDP-N-acetylgalactosamine diphosphorylase